MGCLIVRTLNFYFSPFTFSSLPFLKLPGCQSLTFQEANGRKDTSFFPLLLLSHSLVAAVPTIAEDLARHRKRSDKVGHMGGDLQWMLRTTPGNSVFDILYAVRICILYVYLYVYGLQFLPLHHLTVIQDVWQREHQPLSLPQREQRDPRQPLW